MALPPSPPAPQRPALRPDDGRLARGRRSRARILATARALFRERGFDGTTLRAIARTAGMGASSIYRHVRCKEELLIEDLAARQEEAWRRFRTESGRALDARERLRGFFDQHQALLSEDRDFTTIALRALTHPDARVARQVLALEDRSVGLVAEILQTGRARGEVARDADIVAAARTLYYAALGARIAWAHGLLDAENCRTSIETSVDLLFRGLGRRT
jgi:AcrR family transcriptional regulator